ncbi:MULTISPECIES: DUF2806 domain-containing protein [unclassified Halomonas]|uniref:DUF2806 domain-containing protein n=1 Tax=unclassified Halomonas TaxID=2609666 RepID=UPI002887482C|nr:MULTISPECIES: DUF2806 domain-containing protein [unclassified Halomonas]MDT0501763.1 DUF2806 domain-containing protein [Halomonas sp. PAR7]MDT0513407.1 DUF2806 domain-containing protein [Halomonas sp. LES1]MDT0591826.1 DUF2806 domain-containing protein [Halomonas sp. PAR8]
MDYPGEKLLIKMWETLADKGVGALLAPWHEKRIAATRTEIRRREMLLLAQAEREVESIKSGAARLQINSDIRLVESSNDVADEQEKVEPRLDLAELAASVVNTNFSESIRKETNVAKSVMVAEDILSRDEQEPSDKPIEDDWLYSWRDYAGRVSASELQDLWGRILAGEVKQPGSYSMRTLEFLKGLSKTEAELISKAARFVIGERIYRKKEEFLEKEGLNFSHLLFLQDVGVLSGVEAVGLNTTYKSRDANKFFLPLVASNRIMLLEHEDQEKTVIAEVYLLTQVGIEVLKLASFHVNEEYLESVAQDYAKKGFKVKVADWVQQTASGGQFFNAKEINLEGDV